MQLPQVSLVPGQIITRRRLDRNVAVKIPDPSRHPHPRGIYPPHLPQTYLINCQHYLRVTLTLGPTHLGLSVHAEPTAEPRRGAPPNQPPSGFPLSFLFPPSPTPVPQLSPGDGSDHLAEQQAGTTTPEDWAQTGRKTDEMQVLLVTVSQQSNPETNPGHCRQALSRLQWAHTHEHCTTPTHL